MNKTTITAHSNGPLEVKGAVIVNGPDGKTIKETDENGSVWLCRCGGSKNKPFCDGTHKVNGFRG